MPQLSPGFSLVAYGFLLFVAIYFGAAAIGHRQLLPLKVIRHPLVHSLGLLSITGVLTYFGMVEMAERFGQGAILAFMSLIVLFVISHLLFQPIQWISNANRFPSIADSLVYRFRGLQFGRLIVAIAFITLLPMAAAQIKAAALAIHYFLPVEQTVQNSLLASLPLVVAVLLLLWRYGAGKNHHDTISLAIAAGVLLILATLLLTVVTSVFHVFGSFDGLSEWLKQTSTSTSVTATDFEEGYALIITFLLAGITLPQIFYLQSKVRFESHQLNYASWCFPLVLLLATFPMFPLFWAGSVLDQQTTSQLYILALPDILQIPALRVLVLAGGFSAAAASLLVIGMSISQMIANYWLLPNSKSLCRRDFYSWYSRKTRTIASLTLVLAMLACSLITTDSITDLILVSMTGILQLSPAAIAAFYFPKISRAGITSGLISGIGLWGIGLFIPLFTGEWSWSIPWLNTAIPFGPANWHNWLLEITALNIFLTVLVSRLTTISDDEAFHAKLCVIDSMPVPQRVELAEHSLTEIRRRLSQELGETMAETEIDKALQRLELSKDDSQPFAMRLIRDELSANICKLLGTYLSQQIIDRAIPLTNKPEIGADDINLLETELSKHSKQLTGLSAELNKLRLHHRNTLNNLPIGACSVGSDGEILLWNRAMEEFTGVSAASTQGTLINALPDPWHEILGSFSQSPETQQLAIKVARQSRSSWCNLFKAVIEKDSPELLGSQVLLLEDTTESLALTQELAHTERLASVGRLAAGVAHEIGNPVTGISCLAQDIRAEHSDQNVVSSMEMILAQTHRISRIVSSLINFSRSGDQDSEHYRAFPLKNAVQDAIQLLELQTDSKSICYQNHISDNIETQGDIHQITQVFLNLLTNARDAGPENATVAVAAHIENDHIVTTVSDQGPGIDEAFIEQIFEPFFTTKEVGEGTGLGLSLVYSIIKKHGGNIRFENFDAGGRMVVELPLINDNDSIDNRCS